MRKQELMKLNWILTGLLLAAAICLWNDLRFIVLFLDLKQPDHAPILDGFTLYINGKPEAEAYGLLLLPLISTLSATKNIFQGKNAPSKSLLLLAISLINFFAYIALKGKLHLTNETIETWTALSKYSFEACTKGMCMTENLLPLGLCYTLSVLIFSCPFYGKNKVQNYHLPPPWKI